MTWIAPTLWDLLKPSRKARRSPPTSPAKTPSRNGQTHPPRRPMQRRYDDLVAEMKAAYGVRVRKWRSSSSGCAWEVHYHDGSLARLVESPRPRGPVSCAIFLHEIGHHAIGFGRYRPRCLEEYHAWVWALRTMRERGFRVTKSVETRMAESLRYAVDKARRRGLRNLPAELLPFASPRPAVGRCAAS